MSKLKIPLLSFDAHGTISKAITFVNRHLTNIVEKKPEIPDARSLAQLSWRHMYQKAVALWHALSAAEQQDWESQARRRHMTGFAWFMSQALKPNPGLYLPLQGGTMSGDIDMAKNRLLKLPLPSDSQEAITLAYFTTNIAPYLYNEGARVYHNAHQSIPHNTMTTLAFNSERYDTDAIHDTITNNSRLTCKTAGKYLIIGNIAWIANATGIRTIQMNHSTIGKIALANQSSFATIQCYQNLATIIDMAVNQYVTLEVLQSSGGALNCIYELAYTPRFMMQRIG